MTAARSLAALFVVIFALLRSAPAQACACGCGIFDVGDGTNIPQATDSRLTVFYRISFMDQNHNRIAGHDASPHDNVDKRIETSFHTLGAEYRLSQTWTLMGELPVFDRQFTTTGADRLGVPLIETVPLTDFGDATLNLTYTGIAPDMSSGIGIGIKLPTGRWTSPTDRYGNISIYDRDTLPGTGSTDAQVTGYHVGTLGRLQYFVQTQFQMALAARAGYRPGNELDGALGVSYTLPSRGVMRFTPSVQLLGSLRAHDTGANADPLDSGYQRALIAPGLRVQMTRRLSIYGDIEFPIAQYVNAAASPAANPLGTAGQLVAPVQFKLQINYGL
ncbi:MAG: hypothetical protein KGQ42_08950 [Alphaproteobacteria bacterium]|nr:hypothetical protein [Alphaproteobacteria bacterium]MDE2341306.1 hypothetical protein [Alphaproteobacteria bacterium]